MYKAVFQMRSSLTKIVILTGLIINLIASMLIGYGRIFRSKKTIEKESRNEGPENVHEEKHRLIETRIAQIGAVLLSIGFAVQIYGVVSDD
jgi:uncharacterized protein YqhQ